MWRQLSLKFLFRNRWRKRTKVATAKGDFLPEWTLKTTCVIFIFIPQTKCRHCIHSEVDFWFIAPQGWHVAPMKTTCVVCCYPPNFIFTCWQGVCVWDQVRCENWEFVEYNSYCVLIRKYYRFQGVIICYFHLYNFIDFTEQYKSYSPRLVFSANFQPTEPSA